MSTMHERFDKLRGLRPHLDLEELHQFVQSEIDLAVAEERKRIWDEIEKEKVDENANLWGGDYNEGLTKSQTIIKLLINPKE